MNLKRVTAAVLTAVMLLPGSVFAADKTTETQETDYSGQYRSFEQIAEYVSELYIDDSYTKEDVMASGISKLLENNDPLLVELLKATLESMDDYSEFYTADEYKEFVDKLNKTFYGIGISMHQSDDGYIEVTGFAENNDNAEKAGFKIGDKIYKVDGEDMTGQSMSYVRSKVIGEEGTTVNITVLRDDKEVELTATRVAVNAATVSSGILDGNIGYIQITSFGEDTADEFADALDYMRENDVTKIIMDLRNNTGGVVNAATEIAQMIVPKGKIIDVKYRNSKYNMTYTSDLAEKEFDFAVLVNEYTASASEILASAMQDSGCATLVGTTTFGKAVIQNTFPLNNGSVFKLTVGQYITRNGSEINHIGLTPDKYVENTTENIDTSNYTSFDYKTRASLGSSGDNVKAAKERLKIFGYYSGDTESGVFDKSLKEAVESFQQMNDLFSYGVIDIATQKKLDELFSQITVVQDNQFDTAYELMGGKSE